MFTLIRSRTTSEKPTVWSATAKALAREKINPIDAPSSGPSVREIMKYVPPKYLKISRNKAVKVKKKSRSVICHWTAFSFDTPFILT